MDTEFVHVAVSLKFGRRLYGQDCVEDGRQRGTRLSAKFSEASLEEEEASIGSRSNDWLKGSKEFCERRPFNIFTIVFYQTSAHLHSFGAMQ